MENDFFYRKLNVYHQSKKLVADVYALTKVFPSQEQYGLTNQIQRAVVSIPSNIAEGMGRFSTKERIHFLEIASDSLIEVMCQLEITEMLGYITKSQLDVEEQAVMNISKMLVALRKNVVERQ